MTPKSKVSTPRSIWTKLVSYAKAQGEDPNFILLRFANERLLYRLSVSRYAPRFVLKGAMLFAAWAKLPHRSTRDVDLLGYGSPDELVHTFRDLCLESVNPPDGLQFDPNTVRLETIREAEEYDGRRVLLQGNMAGIPVHLQVDVGFGDAVTPGTIELDFPVLLDGLPSPRLRTYPPETVVAEKFEAMVKLGLANSRMKDFYDLWVLSQTRSFRRSTLQLAARATFERRGTSWPSSTPLALTSDFSDASDKVAQWRSFLRRTRVVEQPPLEGVIARLHSFLSILYSEATTQEDLTWIPAARAWRAP